MISLLQKLLFLKDRFTGLNSCSWGTKHILLFNSSAAAQDVAFMLSGQWDGCNGVSMSQYDEVAVNTAASLVGASWCYNGASLAVLPKLSVEELQRRYTGGERNFANADLRCTQLQELNLSQANLGWAKLSLANLSKANLSEADLTAADLSNANLNGTNLRGANLSRANLRGTNLDNANLSGANLRGVQLN